MRRYFMTNDSPDDGNPSTRSTRGNIVNKKITMLFKKTIICKTVFLKPVTNLSCSCLVKEPAVDSGLSKFV